MDLYNKFRVLFCRHAQVQSEYYMYYSRQVLRLTLWFDFMSRYIYVTSQFAILVFSISCPIRIRMYNGLLNMTDLLIAVCDGVPFRVRPKSSQFLPIMDYGIWHAGVQVVARVLNVWSIDDKMIDSDYKRFVCYCIIGF